MMMNTAIINSTAVPTAIIKPVSTDIFVVYERGMNKVKLPNQALNVNELLCD
ncbi:hypothetical protein GCM10028807_06840 [Spirosoma daeguense]